MTCLHMCWNNPVSEILYAHYECLHLDAELAQKHPGDDE